MANTYKALSPVGEHYFGEGVSEHELSADEERDAINDGHLEIVPRTYKVLSDNYEYPQGEHVELALLKEHEAALLAGGHLERIDAKPKTKAAAKKAKAEETEKES